MRTRIALAFATAAGAMLLTPPAEAGVVDCTFGNLDIPNLNFNVGGAVNCTFDSVSNCLFYYDPLFNFPTRIVPETAEFTTCAAGVVLADTE